MVNEFINFFFLLRYEEKLNKINFVMVSFGSFSIDAYRPQIGCLNFERKKKIKCYDQWLGHIVSNLFKRDWSHSLWFLPLVSHSVLYVEWWNEWNSRIGHFNIFTPIKWHDVFFSIANVLCQTTFASMSMCWMYIYVVLWFYYLFDGINVWMRSGELSKWMQGSKYAVKRSEHLYNSDFVCVRVPS